MTAISSPESAYMPTSAAQSADGTPPTSLRLEAAPPATSPWPPLPSSAAGQALLDQPTLDEEDEDSTVQPLPRSAAELLHVLTEAKRDVGDGSVVLHFEREGASARDLKRIFALVPAVVRVYVSPERLVVELPGLAHATLQAKFVELLNRAIERAGLDTDLDCAGESIVNTADGIRQHNSFWGPEGVLSEAQEGTHMYLEVLSTQTLSSAEKKAQAYLALPSTGSTLLVKPAFSRISSHERSIYSPSNLHLRLEVYSITRSTVLSNPPTVTKELLFSISEGAVPSSSVTIDIHKLVPKLAPTAPPLVLLPGNLSRFFTKIVDRVKIEETERRVRNANRRKARKRA